VVDAAFATTRRLISALFATRKQASSGEMPPITPPKDLVVAARSPGTPQVAIPVTVLVPLLGFDQGSKY